MIRNLKFLGLALVAALAMSSVAACVASADVLTVEREPATLTGSQHSGEDVFKVHGGEVKCKVVSYKGEAKKTGESQFTVTPTYTGCTFVGLNATINMNGCDYLVKIDIGGATTGKVDVVCPAGKEITVTAPSVGTPKCIVHVPEQPGLSTVTGTNIGVGTTREVTLHINITNIKYSQTAGTAETGNCDTKDNTTGGTYTGKALITGEDAAGHLGVFLS